MSLLFRAHAPLHWGDEVHLHVAMRSPNSDVLHTIEPLAFRAIRPGEHMGDPAIRMSHEEAQALMNELWSAGVRPAAGQGSVGQLGAVQAHLEDMRRLAFDMITDNLRRSAP